MVLRRLLFVALLTWLPSGLLVAAEQSIRLADGSALRLFFFDPQPSDEPPPLAIFIAGGSNNEFMAKAQFWLGKEFVDQGWAIAVPLSPDGNRFSQRESSVFPQIIAQLRASHELDASKPLLVGMSSGGSEAIALAARNPQLFRGVVATPGRIKDEQTIEALAGLPIYIRIGEKDDFRWNRQLEPMAQRLRAAGAVVDAAIVGNARHVFQLDWETLEGWLNTLE